MEPFINQVGFVDRLGIHATTVTGPTDVPVAVDELAAAGGFLERPGDAVSLDLALTAVFQLRGRGGLFPWCRWSPPPGRRQSPEPTHRLTSTTHSNAANPMPANDFTLCSLRG